MPKIYDTAESVEAVAKRLIPNFHTGLATARIAYIFVSEGGKSGGKPNLGKARKLSGAQEFLTQKDFVIEVSLNYWNEMSDTQRQALVDHLLESCQGEEDEKTGEIKYSLRKPDVMEFLGVFSRNAAWTAELDSFIRVVQAADAKAKPVKPQTRTTEATETAKT